MTSRHGWMILAVLLLGACTTNFKTPADSDAGGDVLPDGGDGDVDGVDAADDGPGDSDAEDPVPDVTCTSDEGCAFLGGGFICCDSVCVDGATDPMHCGRCDRRCSEVELCCGGSCADISSDRLNCGGCGNACTDMELCCMGVCSDVNKDPGHCGSCDMSCDLGMACSDATCISCESSVTVWPRGEKCYIDEGLGRFSHLSVLAPVFDGRLDRVPEAISPLYNPPLFGVLTVDNVPIDDPTALREYVVQVRRWSPEGGIIEEFVREYAGDGTGILALDAVHLPRPDMPGRLLVTLGGVRAGPTADDLFVDTVDIAPGPLYVEPFVHDSGNRPVAVPAVYWQLPVPYEAALSLAGIAGGAVVGVGSSGEGFNIPAAAIKRRPAADDTMLNWSTTTDGGDERYAYASHVAVGGDGRIFVLVTDDHADSANPINADYDVRLYCYNSSVIDLAGPSPAMEEPCWGEEVPWADIADGSDIDEVGLAMAAGNEGTSYVVYEEGGRTCKIVRVDAEGFVGTPAELSVGSARRIGVSALLVDLVRGAVFVVGYHYDIGISPNHDKTPAIWKFSDGLGVIGDFGTNGRMDYGGGFFSDALLLCDGSILAKIYHDDGDQPVQEHADDRTCLVRYSGTTGNPL
jgi:hypothetical protein